jgi:hypothetical protein
MATEEKKLKLNPPESDNVSGYIHSITPMKIAASGSRFFNLVLQQKEEYTDGVSFNVSAHQQMMEMAKKK